MKKVKKIRGWKNIIFPVGLSLVIAVAFLACWIFSEPEEQALKEVRYVVERGPSGRYSIHSVDDSIPEYIFDDVQIIGLNVKENVHGIYKMMDIQGHEGKTAFPSDHNFIVAQGDMKTFKLKWGLFKDGQLVIDCIFDEIQPHETELYHFYVKIDDLWGLYNDEGLSIWSANYQKDDIWRHDYGNYWAVRNENGKILINFQQRIIGPYDEVDLYADLSFHFRDGDSCGVADTCNQEIIKLPGYRCLPKNQYGLYDVYTKQNSSKCCYAFASYNRKGEVIVPPVPILIHSKNYESSDLWLDGKFVYHFQDESGYYYPTGKKIVFPKSIVICSEFIKNRAIVKSRETGKGGVCDERGNIIIPLEYYLPCLFFREDAHGNPEVAFQKEKNADYAVFNCFSGKIKRFIAGN